ncbi:hypothetical protein JTB14_022140 [Gonioctena quinquepunctata]|nr:hypothetical protein JTB14_022140 [Gonioctena quinquepunctata]
MRFKLISVIAAAFFIDISAVSLGKADKKCGYDNCPNISDTKINVHLIPHSHDDVGWLKTVDEYFYGVHAGIGVNYVISSVLQALKQNSNRRFTQVETAFFWKWWQVQSENVRKDYRELVENGQIEIANGGFVMNDEACVNYQSTIDQFTRGLRILNDTLGPCGTPKVGWQIDPFGHSREQAMIFKQLGFDGVFFARLDFNDRIQRINNKTLDFIWQASPNIDDSGIFYNVMMNHYGAPSGFCFDIMCPDEPVNDNPDSFDYNAPQKKKEFEAVLEDFANQSTTNNILIPMGGDFTYELALEQFINMDKLIKLFEDDEKYNVFYSTPSCYIQAVNKEKPTLEVKTDDFFPYASANYEYWTGYYSSRPNSKRFERIGHNILQASKQLRSFFKMNLGGLVDEDTDPDLVTLQESVAIMQHHDAISGTEKQEVANDYSRLIREGIEKSEKSIGLIIGSLLSKNGSAYDKLALASCLLSNVSLCQSFGGERSIVAVYNPLSRPVSHYIRIPTPTSLFSLLGPKGEQQFDIVSSMANFSFVSYRSTKNELVFVAEDIPPFGINLYHFTKMDPELQSENVEPKAHEANNELKFGTNELNFVLDSFTNRLKSITMNNETLEITQDFYYYPSETGVNNNVASGAYLFRPVKGTKYAEKVMEKPGILEYSNIGIISDEAHIRVNDWIKQVIRVYKDGRSNYIEFDWLVGPIDVNETSRIGKEIISRFTVHKFNNTGVFYTDSNGREMIKRTRNERRGYTYDHTVEPISSNYYPVTSRIAMRDELRQLEVAVLNDRSQGGSSLADGQLELMIHRRLLVDDNKGLSEALNEQEFGQGMVVRGKHHLIFGSTNTTKYSFAAQQRDLQSRLLQAPYILITNASVKGLDRDTLRKDLNFQMKFLQTVF